MMVNALFEKLRLAVRRLSAAEQVSFWRAAATKASAVLSDKCVSQSLNVAAMRTLLSA